MNGGLKPTHIDGATFILIAVFGAMAASFGTDDAAKYINEPYLWWCKQGSAWGGAFFLALKMFRSTSYAQFSIEKKQNGNTEILKKNEKVNP